MHSRIFILALTVSKDVLDNIPSEDELQEEMSGIADYVSEDTDFDEDIELLKQWLGDDNFAISKKAKSKYYQIQPSLFKKMLQYQIRQALQQVAKQLADAQNILETDADNFDAYSLWQIASGVYPRYDFYFHIIGETGVLPWVDILPYCNKPYYIIKSFDYHT